MKANIILDLEGLFTSPQYVKKGGDKPQFYHLLKELENIEKAILTLVKEYLPDDKRDNAHEAIKWVEEMTKQKTK